MLSDTESSSQCDFPDVVQPQPQQPPDSSSDFLSDDDGSGEIREYTGVFEGPEKTLEVCFRKIDCVSNESAITSGEITEDAAQGSPSKKIGLRQLTRDDLDRICSRARCTILSSVSNKYLCVRSLGVFSLCLPLHVSIENLWHDNSSSMHGCFDQSAISLAWKSIGLATAGKTSISLVTKHFLTSPSTKRLNTFTVIGLSVSVYKEMATRLGP